MKLLFAFRTPTVLTILALFLWQLMSAQTSKSDCAGLHAGIAAEPLRTTQGYTEPRVMVMFHLLNDSGADQTTAPESWKIVIDGQELEDSDWIFGNGPAPVGGYGTLSAGATFDFGKALSIAKYFPQAKVYKISWKGRYFQSPTVTVRVPSTEPQKHN